MNIVKYDPFRELRSLQDEMTRLFAGTVPRGYNREEMAGAPGFPVLTFTRTRINWSWRPIFRE